MKAEQLIPHLIELNEMELTIVLEALKYHVEEKSHFPALINKVFQLDEKDEYEIAISNLKEHNSDLLDRCAEAESDLNELRNNIKALL